MEFRIHGANRTNKLFYFNEIKLGAETPIAPGRGENWPFGERFRRPLRSRSPECSTQPRGKLEVFHAVSPAERGSPLEWWRSSRCRGRTCSGVRERGAGPWRGYSRKPEDRERSGFRLPRLCRRPTDACDQRVDKALAAGFEWASRAIVPVQDEVAAGHTGQQSTATIRSLEIRERIMPRDHIDSSAALRISARAV